MKFAIVGGEKKEAAPGLIGACLACGSPALAKCGDIRIHHWAHKGLQACDPWWEKETEWHRDWKNNFPVTWQEDIHTAANGEKHIADVKTATGVILEFQYSALSDDERVSRERFYQNMVWIVNGRRRLRDRAKFFASLTAKVRDKPLVMLANAAGSALLRDWGRSKVPVYFDFGDARPEEQPQVQPGLLWRLHPLTNGAHFVSPASKADLIQYQLNGVSYDQEYADFLRRAVIGTDLRRRR